MATHPLRRSRRALAILDVGAGHDLVLPTATAEHGNAFALQTVSEEKCRRHIRLRSVDGHTVVVVLSGTCETCPISPVTLKAGVERILAERVPGITEVVAIET